MSAWVQKMRVPLVAVALVIALVGAQGLSALAAPANSRSNTARVLGSTGFAYLGGLRTFAAAVLWNQLDPVMHEYYQGRSLKDQNFMLPSMKMVTMLDPKFVEAYYVASFIVAERGDMAGGISTAREGLAKNPTSGLMYANLTQLMLMRNSAADKVERLRLAKVGISDKVEWRSVDDQYDGIVVFRAAYHIAGDKAQVAALNKILKRLAASDDYGTSVDHDHNGDGKQDH